MDKSLELNFVRERVINDYMIQKISTNAKIVFGYGSGSNGIMILGESPAARGGAITGEPFTSPYSGKLLSEILSENNIKKEECFVSNVCFVNKAGNANPSSEDVALCMPYIREILSIVKPKIVILLGRTAGDAFFGSMYYWNKYLMKDGTRFICLYHPAFILRQSTSNVEAYKRKWKEVFTDVKRFE